MILRFDWVFSYWIFVWFLLYWCRWVPFNPKWFLLAGVVENLVMLWLMLLYGTDRRSMVVFVLVNLLIKVWPLLLVWNQQPMNDRQDLAFGVGLFVAYWIWLQLNRQKLPEIVRSISSSLLHGKDQTPVMALLAKYLKHW